MRKLCLLAFAFLIGGCANRPSPPPDCEGVPVQINGQTTPQGASHATRFGN
jgi:hypothetical protein